MGLSSTNLLFGETSLNARRKYNNQNKDLDESEVWGYNSDVGAAPPRRNADSSDGAHNYDDNNDGGNNSVARSRRHHQEEGVRYYRRPQKGSLSDYFFGFMYDENDDVDSNGQRDIDEDTLYSSVVAPSTQLWNALNASLFASLLLSAFADVVPVALVTHMSEALASSSSDQQQPAFAPRATVAAVLGTSAGKFVNGPAGDVLGARRTSAAYSVAMSISLIVLACSTTTEMAAWAVFFVEFFYSVQWPCSVVTLATHYRGNASGAYEGGIYVTSLAARLGSLVSFPTCSLLLRHVHWRVVALVGSWVALLASSVTYLYVKDSPNKADDPQNPIDPNLLLKWFPDHVSQRKQLSICVVLRMAAFVFQENVFPSMRHILCSGTFWIVALAHTGASMVRTSERVLGTYLYETSNGTLSESRSAGLAVFLSIGTVAGLIVAGNMFASREERERKWLVSRLYMVTIASSYTLALFAIPSLRFTLNSPELITAFQVMAITTAGFGIAVQFYHIPSLVGATFGCDKGLFSSYSDGVAYGVASLVWRVVSDVVEHGSNEGGGWAYGWAAVALLLILTGLLMVEFMEHYFCRHKHGSSSYETILFV